MKNMGDYKLYPKSKDRVITEIKQAFDDYDNDEIRDNDFIELMCHYRDYTKDQEFLGTVRNEYSGDGINEVFEVSRTTEARIGKNRSQRLEKILTKY